MMQEVIDCVLYFGKKENVPEGIIIRDMHENVEFNDVEYDDIEGVYDYDIQQNLYPQNNNNDNNDNATDDNEDNESKSSHSNNDNNDEQDDEEDNLNDNIEIIRNKNNLETVVENREGNLDDNQCIENLIEDMENNMNQEMQEFNNINKQVDNTIQNIENDLENDETPVKQNRKQPNKYVPSFNNKVYTQIKGVSNKNGIVDEITFAQVLYKVFGSKQMSLNAGIRIFGDGSIKGMTKNYVHYIFAIALLQE